eukprot:gene1617-1957_t
MEAHDTLISGAKQITLKVQDHEYTLVRNYSADPHALVHSMGLFQAWLNQRWFPLEADGFPNSVELTLRTPAHYLYSNVNSAEPSWSVLLFCCNSTCTDGISSSTFFTPLRSLSWQLSAQHLQDLEDVLQDKHKTSQFLAVPFELLLQLVSSFETRVASESTVVTAIHLWLFGQPEDSVSMEQKRLLAKQVRLAGLSTLFMAQVLPYVQWYREAVGIDTCLQAVGYLNLKQQLSSKLLNGSHSSNTTTPTIQQSAPQPAHSDSSCNGTISKGGTLMAPALLTNSPCPASCTSNTLLAKAMEALLQSNLPPEQGEFWRLALLRQPRQSSAISQLQLLVSLGHNQLVAAYDSRATGDWHRGDPSMFVGVSWRLCWRFTDISLKARCPLQLPALHSGSKRSWPQSQEEDYEEVDSCEQAAAAASTARPSAKSWQLQVGVCFKVSGLVAGASAQLALPVLELSHMAAVCPGGTPRTRQQLQRCGGVSLQQQYQVVAAGQIVPCLQLLPTCISSSSWDSACDKQLGRFMDSNGELQLVVKVHNNMM